MDDVLRQRELTPTWAVYEGLAEVDNGLEVVLGGLAALLGLSGGASVQVCAARPT
jgi:hypothetical protein